MVSPAQKRTVRFCAWCSTSFSMFRAGGINILNQKQKQCTSSAPRCFFFLICQEVADVARLLLDKPRAYHLQKMILQTWPQVVVVWLGVWPFPNFSSFSRSDLHQHRVTGPQRRARGHRGGEPGLAAELSLWRLQQLHGSVSWISICGSVAIDAIDRYQKRP